MQFIEGANVITSKGDKVGEINRVVIDPKSKDVTHLIVEKGFLFKEDKVVPLELIHPKSKDEIVLDEEAGDLDQLPNFIEKDYTATTETIRPINKSQPVNQAGSVYAYPPIGSRWSTGFFDLGNQPQYVADRDRNIPEGSVALKEGADVISSDGEHVGDIERIFTDNKNVKVTHILISQGIFLKERKLVPVSWISDVFEESVHLSVDSEYIENLPEYEAE